MLIVVVPPKDLPVPSDINYSFYLSYNLHGKQRNVKYCMNDENGKCGLYYIYLHETRRGNSFSNMVEEVKERKGVVTCGSRLVVGVMEKVVVGICRGMVEEEMEMEEVRTCNRMEKVVVVICSSKEEVGKEMVEVGTYSNKEVEEMVMEEEVIYSRSEEGVMVKVVVVTCSNTTEEEMEMEPEVTAVVVIYSNKEAVMMEKVGAVAVIYGNKEVVMMEKVGAVAVIYSNKEVAMMEKVGAVAVIYSNKEVVMMEKVGMQKY